MVISVLYNFMLTMSQYLFFPLQKVRFYDLAADHNIILVYLFA